MKPVLPALLALILATDAAAQPADTLAVPHTMTREPGPIVGPADVSIVTAAAPLPAHYARGVSLVAPDFQALPHEATAFVGTGTVGVRVTSPVVRRALSSTSAVGVTATGALGTHRAAGGAFCTLGTVRDYVLASAGAGAWAETSPEGRALGPAVEARVRPFFFFRGEAGAVVAGRRAWWTRIGVDLPLPIIDSGMAAFVGLTIETRHFSDTGRSLRLYGASLTF